MRSLADWLLRIDPIGWLESRLLRLRSPRGLRHGKLRRNKDGTVWRDADGRVLVHFPGTIDQRDLDNIEAEIRRFGADWPKQVPAGG